MRARFRRRRELLYELENHAALLAVVAPLLEELGEFLEARQCGVLALECRLRHRNVPPTRCVLRLAAPLADPGQIAALLGERMSALVLPEAVRACELLSGALVARVLDSGGLWRAGEHGGGAGAQAPDLIERLRVRLGGRQCMGFGLLRTIGRKRPGLLRRGFRAACEVTLRERRGARRSGHPWRRAPSPRGPARSFCNA